ncbi:MAG: hypothetical protein IPK12_01495 [Gemmatimonadetes bacterium]|nr:hypothetical protein [Gemmatimonadota bacterium]
MRLAQDTRFLKAAGGQALGTLLAGTSVTPGKTSGSHTEVEFEGWVFSASLGPFSRDGFDLIVTRRPSENLRAEPDGTLLARLGTGTGFVKVDTRGGWTRVRRKAWVETQALGRPATAAAPRPGTTPTPAQQAAPPAAAPVLPSEVDRAELARKATLAIVPEGAALGGLDSGAAVRIVSRSGGWSRIQVEAWVPDSTLRPAESGVLVGVSPAEIRANPARFVGQVVEWRLQFVALQTADELRPEIPVGRRYLLMRGPLPEPGFVYVVVSPDQVARLEQLPALKELLIRGTIRAATSRYLPTPVLELVAIMEGA